VIDHDVFHEVFLPSSAVIPSLHDDSMTPEKVIFSVCIPAS
jgi:hypothetical protein